MLSIYNKKKLQFPPPHYTAWSIHSPFGVPIQLATDSDWIIPWNFWISEHTYLGIIIWHRLQPFTTYLSLTTDQWSSLICHIFHKYYSQFPHHPLMVIATVHILHMHASIIVSCENDWNSLISSTCNWNDVKNISECHSTYQVVFVCLPCTKGILEQGRVNGLEFTSDHPTLLLLFFILFFSFLFGGFKNVHVGLTVIKILMLKNPMRNSNLIKVSSSLWKLIVWEGVLTQFWHFLSGMDKSTT